MVWGLIASDGRSQLLIAEHGIKVNTDVYLEVMEEHLQWLREEYGGAAPELRGALWFQDSAPAHGAARTQEFLKEKLGEFGIRFIEKASWPPSSPELNPMDFAVWAPLKRAVQVHKTEYICSYKGPLLTITFLSRGTTATAMSSSSGPPLKRSGLRWSGRSSSAPFARRFDLVSSVSLRLGEIALSNKE